MKYMPHLPKDVWLAWEELGWTTTFGTVSPDSSLAQVDLLYKLSYLSDAPHVGAMASNMVAFVLTVELAGDRAKTIVGINAETPFAIGEALVSIVGIWVKDWRDFHACFTIHFVDVDVQI